MGYVDGLNVYLYVGNNPVNRYDPEGLEMYYLMENEYLKDIEVPSNVTKVDVTFRQLIKGQAETHNRMVAGANRPDLHVTVKFFDKTEEISETLAKAKGDDHIIIHAHGNDFGDPKIGGKYVEWDSVEGAKLIKTLADDKPASLSLRVCNVSKERAEQLSGKIGGAPVYHNPERDTKPTLGFDTKPTAYADSQHPYAPTSVEYDPAEHGLQKTQAPPAADKPPRKETKPEEKQ